MTPSINLVSEYYIKTYTSLGTNVDPKNFLPFVPAAQDTYIQPILGTNFYEYILTQFAASALTTSEYYLVHDKIQPAIAWRAASMAMPWLSMPVTNKGPQRMSGDFSTSVDLTDMKYLKAETANMAEFYEERLKTFLCASGTTYPQYTANNTTDMVPDKASAYDSDLAIPRAYSRIGNLYDGFHNGFYNNNGGCC